MPIQTSTLIKPCLWFDDDLEEAVAFYTSVFPDSEVGHIARLPTGAVFAGDFRLGGVSFQGINGGPEHAGFAMSISFAVTCADQAEVDHYWTALTADGGEESMCGWLTDRFGLSWQIVPQRLYDLLGDADPARAQAASQALLSMRRIIVADLEQAADAATAS